MTPIAYTLTPKAHTALQEHNMTRYTKNDIRHYIDICNRHLEAMDAGYVLQYESAYGGHAVSSMYTNQNGTERNMLIGYLPARECYRFIFGMYQALNMVHYTPKTYAKRVVS